MIPLDDFQNLEGNRATERRSAEGGGMRAGGKKAGVFFTHPECANGKSAPEGFGHGDSIGGEVGRAIGVIHPSLQDPLPALKFSGAKMAGLHLIEEKEQIPLIAELTQSAQILRRGDGDAAFSLDGLD